MFKKQQALKPFPSSRPTAPCQKPTLGQKEINCHNCIVRASESDEVVVKEDDGIELEHCLEEKALHASKW